MAENNKDLSQRFNIYIWNKSKHTELINHSEFVTLAGSKDWPEAIANISQRTRNSTIWWSTFDGSPRHYPKDFTFHPEQSVLNFFKMNRLNETDDAKLEQQRRVNFIEEPETREFLNDSVINSEKVGSEKGSKVPVIQREGATIAERQVDLQNAITWVRKELQELQLQDKNLARQLIALRQRIKNMTRVEGDDILNDSEATESFDSGISAM